MNGQKKNQKKTALFYCPEGSCVIYISQIDGKDSCLWKPSYLENGKSVMPNDEILTFYPEIYSPKSYDSSEPDALAEREIKKMYLSFITEKKEFSINGRSDGKNRKCFINTGHCPEMGRIYKIVYRCYWTTLINYVTLL